MIIALLACFTIIVVCSFNLGAEVERDRLTRRALPVWKRLGAKEDE